jgi:hypothetical protein
VHYLHGSVRWMRLKGTVSRDGYFFISTFCVCAEGFQGLSKAFHYPIKLLTFNLLLLLWNYLLILKMLTETLLRIPFSVISRRSLLPTSHWLQGKWARIYLRYYFWILQNHRRLHVSIFSVKIAALGSLKRVTGRIFKINKVISKEQAKTFQTSMKQKFLKTISACKESTFLT